MERKKTGTLIDPIPFMDELETAKERLLKALGNYSKNVIPDDDYGIKLWEKNVLRAEEYLNHPKCSARDHGIHLRTIAVKQYNLAVEARQKHIEHRQELSSQLTEVKKAILSLQPKQNSDLLHRLAYLENSSLVPVASDRETHTTVTYVVEKDIQKTLFTVEALLSLQKESIES